MGQRNKDDDHNNEVENYDDDDNEVENDDDDDCVVENDDDDDNEVENENDLITVLRTIRGRSPSPSTRPRRKMASVSEIRSLLLSSPSMPFLLVMTDVAVVVIVVALVRDDDHC